MHIVVIVLPLIKKTVPTSVPFLASPEMLTRQSIRKSPTILNVNYGKPVCLPNEDSACDDGFSKYISRDFFRLPGCETEPPEHKAKRLGRVVCWR